MKSHLEGLRPDKKRSVLAAFCLLSSVFRQSVRGRRPLPPTCFHAKPQKQPTGFSVHRHHPPAAAGSAHRPLPAAHPPLSLKSWALTPGEPPFAPTPTNPCSVHRLPSTVATALVNGQWSMVNGQWSMVSRSLSSTTRNRSPTTSSSPGCNVIGSTHSKSPARLIEIEGDPSRSCLTTPLNRPSSTSM